ncbi:MAG TPA: hypothetical protein PLG59_18360, partial [bacterium]|nr:hypothetical protein [bacterium]
MTNSHNDDEKILDLLKDRMKDDPPADLISRMEDRLSDFRGKLPEHPYIRSLEHGDAGFLSFLRSPYRLRWASAVGIVLLAAISLWMGGPNQATWAEVAERFRSIPFFSATVYFKEDALSEPIQFELWMGRGGKARMRYGKQVLFAEKGKVLKAFHLEARTEVPPNPMAEQILSKLGSGESFSLETVLQSCAGKLSGFLPVSNAEALIAEDLTIFDVTNDRTPEWLRIWALRESKLPLRVRFWDPRDAECMDMLFSYSRQQPDECFDADVFEKKMKGSKDVARNLAYALLQDPGRRPLTTEDLFEESGYHLPTVDDVGITSDGIVWVVAGHSMNRGKDGNVFYGFEELKDDLGRDYIRRQGTHRTLEDQSIDLFIPVDYGNITGSPTRLTFVCKVEKYRRNDPEEVVGSVEIENWKKRSPWPQDLLGNDTWNPLITLADYFKRKKNWTRLEEILNLIPGNPADDPNALIREQIRLDALFSQSKYENVIHATEILLPTMQDKIYVNQNRSSFSFEQYLVSLVACKEVDQAKDILQHRLAQLTSEQRKVYDDWMLESLVQSFSSHLSLTVDEIGSILGIDVYTDKRIQHFSGWDWG